MIKCLVVLLLICIHGNHAQQYVNNTILESLQSISPVLYNAIHSSVSVPEITDLLNQNITFFLPAEAALNASITSGKLNFSSNAYSALQFLTLNGSHHANAFSASRKFYTTNSHNLMSIGPTLLPNYTIQANRFEIYSGITKATIVSQNIQCSNGLIHMVDNFLQPASTPLITISDLAELEYMEGLLKSLNVSDTVSGMNKTILAPTNEAWTAANGSTLPFGTLIHNLKYLVIDGSYTSDLFLSEEPVAYTSDYRNMPITIQLQQGKLLVNGAASIVKTDIMTTSGIIHIIDTVLSADAILESTRSNASATTPSSTSSNGGTNDDNSTTNKKMPPLDSSSMASSLSYSNSVHCIYYYVLICLISYICCL
ncbi:FAS1 domain-containing protein [Mucor lusitanicus]|uniref:FAS1 domain-containing protein n=2 Tax=Mucor circinelloides f. lusitanicus TaxID=29924 RepID=A0A168HDT1_MUCCL|nr:FAS1 domain-containing protein [Mucor lusitanicus]OAC98672.1 hypothetical protein MUCCIDRAFT_93034 [Mucor lusitanicus CBS 277.49]